VQTATLVTVATDLPLELRRLARFQAGMLSRAQIVGAGLSGQIVRSRLRRGSWQQSYPGVYRTSSGEPSREASLWAAILYAGPGAMLSHQTAAELWKLTDEPSSLIHVTIPGDRRVRKQPGIVFHLSKRAGNAAHPSRLPPQTRIEETVLDLWDAARDLDAAVGWVTRAFGRRLTTQGQLLRALSSRHRIRRRAQLAELLSPDWAGIHSVLEYRYVRDVERPHGFPAATRQAPSRLGGRNVYRDTLYEAYKTAVELDGRVAHPGDTRWNDIRRDNAATTEGISTLRYGWPEVTITPCEVAAEVATTLAGHGYTLARPCSPACPVGREPAYTQSLSPTGPGRHTAPRRRAPLRSRRQPAQAARGHPKGRAGQT
jgi:hypothetical protein